METTEYSLLLKKGKKRKSPAMKCFQMGFQKGDESNLCYGQAFLQCSDEY